MFILGPGLSPEANKALLNLARRKSFIDYDWWFDVYSIPNLYKHKCFICGESFTYDLLDDHGWGHLKELNLLPFL